MRSSFWFWVKPNSFYWIDQENTLYGEWAHENNEKMLTACADRAFPQVGVSTPVSKSVKVERMKVDSCSWHMPLRRQSLNEIVSAWFHKCNCPGNVQTFTALEKISYQPRLTNACRRRWLKEQCSHPVVPAGCSDISNRKLSSEEAESVLENCII